MGRLADAFEAQQHSHQGPPCSVQLILESLSTDDRDDLVALLASSRKSTHLVKFMNTVLHDEVLAAIDGPIGDGTLQRHRRGVCRCGTSR